MRVYVAAKFEEAVRASRLMALLRIDGHRISYDWTVHAPGLMALLRIDGDRVTFDMPPSMSDAEIACIAHLDIEGVRTADAIVVLYHPRLKGGLVEMGGALALGIRVVVVDADPADPCIFFRHPSIEHVESDEVVRGQLLFRGDA